MPTACPRGAFLHGALALSLLVASLKGSQAVQVGRDVFIDPTTPMLCQQNSAQGSLPVGTSYFTTTLPNRFCVWYTIPAKTIADEPTCQATNSVVSIEFWALSWAGDEPDSVPPGLQTVDKVFLAATPNANPAMVQVTETQILYSSGSLLDESAINRSRNYHSIRVPLSTFNSRGVGSRWIVTLANLNPYGRSIGTFALRLSCYPADQPPCPSASPDWGECSQGITISQGSVQTVADATQAQGFPIREPIVPAGSCERTTVTLGTTTSIIARCVCAPGWTGQACSYPVVNISDATTGSTTGGTTGQTTTGALIDVRNLTIPPRTWVYMWAKLPPMRLVIPRLLAELSQAPGSGSTLDPMLVITPTQVMVNGTVLPSPAPTLADLLPQLRYTSGNFQDLRQSYGALALAWTPSALGGFVPDAVWIGLFNAAPLPPANVAPPADSPVYSVTLKLSRNTAPSASSPSTTLCPKDCSGRGQCVEPVPASGASYQCQCNLGWGGPYCQGPVEEVTLGPGATRPWRRVPLSSGQWAFYIVSYSANGLTTQSNSAYYSALNVTFRVERAQGSSSPPSPFGDPTFSNAMHIVVAPYYPGLSVGNVYFNSTRPLSFEGNVQLSIKGPSSVTTWVLAVYANDLDPVPAGGLVYSLAVAWDVQVPSPAGSLNLSKARAWYTVFIAAVAGSITLALCGIIAARFVVARRQRRRAERRRRQGLDAGGGWEGVEMRAGVRTQSKGLHPMVVASFPVAQYTGPDQLRSLMETAAPPRAHSKAPPPPTGPTDTTNAHITTPTGPDIAGLQSTEHDTSTELAAITVAPTHTLTPPPPAATHTGADTNSNEGSSVDKGTSEQGQGQTQEQQGVSTEGLDGDVAGGSSAAAPAGTTAWWRRGSADGAGAGDVGGGAGTSTAPACAVCLCEYETGESLRILKPCGHPFHQECIDKWLENHDTCPMCRVDLRPPGIRDAETPDPLSPARRSDETIAAQSRDSRRRRSRSSRRSRRAQAAAAAAGDGVAAPEAQPATPAASAPATSGPTNAVIVTVNPPP